MDGWMEEWMDGRMDGWVDGWMKEENEIDILGRILVHNRTQRNNITFSFVSKVQ